MSTSCPLSVGVGCVPGRAFVLRPDQLEKKLQRLARDGHRKLQIVADFDCTLTRQRPNPGCKLLSSFGMFCECPSVPDHYKNEDRRLCEIYKPIEVNPFLSVKDKTAHMEEWYRAANNLLQGFKYPQEEMKVVSENVAQNLRDGVIDMFTVSNQNDIPILVFSAGMGNAVVSVLECAKIMTPNVNVISNFLNFNDEGFIDGMKGTIIHVFNKNETVIKGTEYYDLIKDRTNVIVLGDSLGDAGMADGMDHSEAVIKIGFLYHNVEGNLPFFMKSFDIVLVDDQTMEIANNIINLVKS
ncbi:cytosolic 5'-nucleotidase IIIB [Arctopsyche grandis]|uniref:cytosolic 5'-nucleotidase IIIB n=1 Tax=Arctopsyche grandis TaxID=121162 RepID=UPI00406D8EA1